MARRILLITTDQMRYDALGCNGGVVARTPVLDGLAASGVRFSRAHAQHVVCMPARATIVTGQYPRSHGVWMNGVALPEDHPNVARYLHHHGFKTALIGKAHFEPWLANSRENRMARKNDFGPYRGFDHMELANHFFLGGSHYEVWMRRHHAAAMSTFYPIVGPDGRQNSVGAGDTGAVQVWANDVPRDLYHTDWVASRTIRWLDQRSDDDDWFAWMSFPDPHHPWDPPKSELPRVPWRDLALPERYPRTHDARLALLDAKPRHWRAAYEATVQTNVEMPPGFVPAQMTADQLREVDATIHVENELIDEACGRVFNRLRARGWFDQVDILFTTDHGELQGDFGLLFKGPFHVESLLRLPLLWRPAGGCPPAEVSRPVGQLNLAPTFCALAGLEVPPWMEGKPLPRSDADADARGFERAITEWDSEHARPGTFPMDPKDAITVHLRTLYRDGQLCTVYEQSSLYDGTEGELYDLDSDPMAHANLWDDPARQSLKRDLIDDLYAALPREQRRWPRVAPV